MQQGKVYLISKASLRNKRGNFNQARRAGAWEGSAMTASQRRWLTAGWSAAAYN